MSRKEEILRNAERERKAEEARKKMQGRDDGYSPRGMKVRTPLGCIIIPFILAAIVFYVLIKLN